jgi:hypothetical protein
MTEFLAREMTLLLQAGQHFGLGHYGLGYQESRREGSVQLDTRSGSSPGFSDENRAAGPNPEARYRRLSTFADDWVRQSSTGDLQQEPRQGRLKTLDGAEVGVRSPDLDRLDRITGPAGPSASQASRGGKVAGENLLVPSDPLSVALTRGDQQGGYGCFCGCSWSYAFDDGADQLTGLPAETSRSMLQAVAGPVGSTAAATFTDVSTDAGFSGMNASWGMSLFDYDRDGWIDVLTYAHLQEVTGSVGLQLWRNLGTGAFTDVTQAAGLFNLTGDTHGTAVGDVNADGIPDLYLINGSIKINQVDLDKLWLGGIGGSFKEIGEAAGVQGVAARGRGLYMFDANRDGRLDMFAARFDRPEKEVDYDLGNQLFLNNGNATFTDVGKDAGIDRSLAENRAAAWADYDGDGHTDLLVTGPTVLWRSNGDGTYADVTAAAGIAPSDQATAAAWGDYNQDGLIDLYVSNGFDAGRSDQLYRNLGNGTFSDVTTSAGLTGNFMKRGVTWGDYDNDGDLDLYVVSLTNRSRPNQLYRNRGDGTFEEVGIDEGAAAQVEGNGSAAVFFDSDNDGDLDLFITNGEGNAIGPYTLLRNQGNSNGWFKLNLVGSGKSNPDALGAGVQLSSSTVGTQYRWHHGPHHFLSQSLLPMHFGLGADTSVEDMSVTWPDGSTQQVNNLARNQHITLVQGRSIWQDAPVISIPGAYVWQTGTRWRVVLKGFSGGTDYSGTIRSGAPISSIRSQGFESGDSVTQVDSRNVSFSVNEGGRGGIDSFDFTTRSNNLTIEIFRNGVADPQTVYLGKYMVRPAVVPMNLSR